ncbi:MAG: FAD:protein FMN transferase [Candidatus Moranbacteria bacterium]|nr:FAD:protein FMN transferase [Candidatus Moranbacteria bacterium]
MSSWQVAEHEEKGTIMKTDVFIRLTSDAYSRHEMVRDIDRGFQMFRAFAKRFSRFEKESELSRFNASEGGKVSAELFSLLKECARFCTLTDSIFDPGILPVLEKIGYRGTTVSEASTTRESFTQLIFDEGSQTIHKPKNLLIDLGGIGKGYIVDQVADELSKKYVHGIVDAGGDMRILGRNREQNLDYWAIDVENPFDASQPLAVLLLSECAVATSGTNRRKWRHAGREYHHLIDPKRETSAQMGVVQVTVITKRAVEADVFAKTLLILGLERGQRFAEEKNIPALFVTDDKRIIRNALFQKYEWKA